MKKEEIFCSIKFLFLKKLFLSLLLTGFLFIFACVSPPMTSPPLDKAAERFLEQIGYIITPQEEKIFREIPPEDRAKFIEEFWRRRDPTPETEVNEFRQAYYTRMAIADRAFQAGVPGWKTDRGRIYILLGPPTDVIKKTMGDTPSEFGQTRRELSSNLLEEGTVNERPSEIWVYNQYPDYFSGPLRLVFVATEGTKDYKLVSDITIRPFSMISYYSFDPNLLYYQRVAEVTDDSSSFPIPGIPDFNVDLEKIARDEQGQPAAFFSLSVPFRSVTFRQDGDKWVYQLKFTVEVKFPQNKEVFRLQRDYQDSLHLDAVKQKFKLNENLADTWVVPLGHGVNQMILGLEDMVSQKTLRKLRLIKAK